MLRYQDEGPDLTLGIVIPSRVVCTEATRIRRGGRFYEARRASRSRVMECPVAVSKRLR